MFWPELTDQILVHLGGDARHEIAVFNRTSAGLIAAICSIARAGTVISYAARAGAAHVSIGRGAQAARGQLVEVSDFRSLSSHLATGSPRLLVITSVSSELDALDSREIEKAGSLARRHDVPVLLDDAYGARMRPVLQNGPRSLELPVDLAISNSDKAGLQGPRAGFPWLGAPTC